MSAFHHMTREQFDAAIAALRVGAQTANDDEMYIGLLRITAMVGDAHTFVGGYPNRRKIPIIAVQFGSDWRVVRATDASKALLGGRLVRIDDASIGDVVQKVRTVLPQDETEEYVRSSVPGWIVSPEALHGSKVIEDPPRIRVTVKRDGPEQTLSLDSIPIDAPLQLKVAEGPAALFRQNPEDSFVVRWLEPQKTVYVNFRTYKDLGS